MPYVLHSRGRNYRFVGGKTDTRPSNGFPVTSTAHEFRFARLIEHVYSWRTGKRSLSDAAPSPDTKGFWGIKGPKESGSLTDQLGDRKRYYEEVMRAAFPAETASGAVSLNRTSKTDSGHLFSKVTALRDPIWFRYRIGTGDPVTPGRKFQTFDTSAFLGTQAGDYRPRVQNHSWVPNPVWSIIGSQSTPTQRQGTANAFFTNSTPERPTAHLLTTVVELLRGDIPSLLKNYQRALLRHQSRTRALQYAGGEYLNIVFGWLPLIQEYANVLKVLISLDRMVYSESNRRHRAWDGPSVSSVNDRLNVPFTATPYTGGGEEFQAISGTPNVGNPGNWNIRVYETSKEDYRFSSRYSALVKPNDKSVGFVEKAEEVLRQLGLVDDPTILWELTPFSWLVDWVANIGNSISNAHLLSPISGRHAVDYAYLTTQLSWSQKDELVKFNTFQSSFTTWDMNIRNPTGFHSSISRVRDRATPFGFGTQLGSLDASQYAILVALGLARTR